MATGFLVSTALVGTGAFVSFFTSFLTSVVLVTVVGLTATLPVTVVVGFLVGLDFVSLAPFLTSLVVTGALVAVFPSTAAFFYSSAFSALTLLFFLHSATNLLYSSMDYLVFNHPSFFSFLNILFLLSLSSVTSL